MEYVVLVIHGFLCVALIALVLMQRSDGSGIGIDGSGSNPLGQRGSSNPLTKATAITFSLFLVTSISLAFMAGGSDGGVARGAEESVFDQVPAELPAVPAASTAAPDAVDPAKPAEAKPKAADKPAEKPQPAPAAPTD